MRNASTDKAMVAISGELACLFAGWMLGVQDNTLRLCGEKTTSLGLIAQHQEGSVMKENRIPEVPQVLQSIYALLLAPEHFVTTDSSCERPRILCMVWEEV